MQDADGNIWNSEYKEASCREHVICLLNDQKKRVSYFPCGNFMPQILSDGVNAVNTII